MDLPLETGADGKKMGGSNWRNFINMEVLEVLNQHEQININERSVVLNKNIR